MDAPQTVSLRDATLDDLSSVQLEARLLSFSGQLDTLALQHAWAKISGDLLSGLYFSNIQGLSPFLGTNGQTDIILLKSSSTNAPSQCVPPVPDETHGPEECKAAWAGSIVYASIFWHSAQPARLLFFFLIWLLF